MICFSLTHLVRQVHLSPEKYNIYLANLPKGIKAVFNDVAEQNAMVV